MSNAAFWLLMIVSTIICAVGLFALWQIGKQIKASQERADHLERIAHEIWPDMGERQ